MKYLIIFLFPMAAYSTPLSDCTREYEKVTRKFVIGGEGFFRYCHGYYLDHRAEIEKLPLDKTCYDRFEPEYNMVERRVRHSILRMLCSLETCDIWARRKGYCK